MTKEEAGADVYNEHKSIGLTGYVADPHAFEREQREMAEENAEQSFNYDSPGHRTRSRHVQRNGRNQEVISQDSRNDPAIKPVRANFYHLLVKLWPGNWRKHLRNLNEQVAEYNETVENDVALGRYSARSRPTTIKVITAKEFWVFWGLVLYSAIVDAKGKLWETAEEHDGMQSPCINMTKFMPKHRFTKIRRFIPHMSADLDRKETSHWWQVDQ